jgi:hypothetical protein
VPEFTLRQAQKLLILLKLDHQRLRDMMWPEGYDESDLCDENLEAIRFLTKLVGEEINEGK